MKTEQNILIAFVLNLSFSIFEFFGGVFTGSVAIVSDAVHDLGDSASIGISYFLEKKSKKQPDDRYTYGYARYSVIGGLITTVILLLGSGFVIYNAICRIITPTEINYNGMIIFAVVGVCVNLCAAFFTGKGASLNQKAVNLHMLEDVLGWAFVLVGAVVMRFTNISIIDPIMSMGVALFILIHATGNLKEVVGLFLEKTPHNIDVAELKEHIEKIDGVIDVHHIHIWSLDTYKNLATMHIITDNEPHNIKAMVREELRAHGIGHVTIEIETSAEQCHEKHCHIAPATVSAHGCHHHHSHHSY
ncbi:MAG: cation transporter [Oscillospiraceae bacterium]|nr:cation transporter [Oscillospiraceae bacterium]